MSSVPAALCDPAFAPIAAAPDEQHETDQQRAPANCTSHGRDYPTFLVRVKSLGYGASSCSNRDGEEAQDLGADTRLCDAGLVRSANAA